MPVKPRSTHSHLLAALVVLSMTAVACDDHRRHGAAQATSLPAVAAPVLADAAPMEVARVLLTTLREAQLTRQLGLGPPENRRRYETALAALRSLAAAERIPADVKAAGPPNLPRDLAPEATLTLAVESWLSTTAYYVDGFLWETMSQPAGSADAATVHIEAERPQDAYRLSQLLGQAGAELPEQTTETGRQGAGPSLESLRAASLQASPPFNVPIRARISLDLVRQGGAWRVRLVYIGPDTLPEALRPATPPASDPVVPLAPVAD